VQQARDAFLAQPLMTSRGLSDQYLFDGDPATVFAVAGLGRDQQAAACALRVDFATPIAFDVLEVHTQAPDRTLRQNLVSGAEFSRDLAHWSPAEELIQHGDTLAIYPPAGPWRCFRLRQPPERVSEVAALKDGKQLDRANWRASNLFAHPAAVPAVAAWSATVTVDEITPTSYLCVAVEGKHGKEGCYAAIRCGNRLIGAPDRAPSYPANPWELPPRASETGYTYFFPLDPSLTGQPLEVILLGMKHGGRDLQSAVWLTARDLPFRAERVTLPR
jgi:hypothetical protein